MTKRQLRACRALTVLAARRAGCIACARRLAQCRRPPAERRRSTGSPRSRGPARLAGSARRPVRRRTPRSTPGARIGQKTPGTPTAGTIPSTCTSSRGRRHRLRLRRRRRGADQGAQPVVRRLFPDGADTGFTLRPRRHRLDRERRLVRPGDVRGRDRDEVRLEAGRSGRPQHLLDERRRVPRLGLLPERSRRRTSSACSTASSSTTARSRVGTSRFNLGYTATHEVGHYLGLAHTFEQGCIGCRRLRRRHAVHGRADVGLPDRQGHVHRGPGARPDPQLHGLLDDPCYTQFTAGQTERMQKQYAHWRLKRA